MRLPRTDLDQVHLPDPVMNDIRILKIENEVLRERLAELELKINKEEQYEDL